MEDSKTYTMQWSYVSILCEIKRSATNLWKIWKLKATFTMLLYRRHGGFHATLWNRRHNRSQFHRSRRRANYAAICRRENQRKNAAAVWEYPFHDFFANPLIKESVKYFARSTATVISDCRLQEFYSTLVDVIDGRSFLPNSLLVFPRSGRW